MSSVMKKFQEDSQKLEIGFHSLLFTGSIDCVAGTSDLLFSKALGSCLAVISRFGTFQGMKSRLSPCTRGER